MFLEKDLNWVHHQVLSVINEIHDEWSVYSKGVHFQIRKRYNQGHYDLSIINTWAASYVFKDLESAKAFCEGYVQQLQQLGG